MSDQQQGENAITQFKKLLYNFDVMIEYAKGEIAMHDCNMKLYANSRKKKEKAKFVSHKIDKQKFEIYLEELINAKKEIIANLNSVIDKYNPIYKKIFYMKYFEEKTNEEIADNFGYSLSGIKKICKKMREDFIDITIK